MRRRKRPLRRRVMRAIQVKRIKGRRKKMMTRGEVKTSRKEEK